MPLPMKRATSSYRLLFPCGPQTQTRRPVCITPLLSATGYGRIKCFRGWNNPKLEVQRPVPNSLLCAVRLKTPHRDVQHCGKHLFPCCPTHRACRRSFESCSWNLWGSARGITNYTMGSSCSNIDMSPTTPVMPRSMCASNIEDFFDIVRMDTESGLDTKSSLDITIWRCTNMKWMNSVKPHMNLLLLWRLLKTSKHSFLVY